MYNLDNPFFFSDNRYTGFSFVTLEKKNGTFSFSMWTCHNISLHDYIITCQIFMGKYKVKLLKPSIFKIADMVKVDVFKSTLNLFLDLKLNLYQQ